MTIRNVVCIAHVDPDLHEWFKDEATRRSQEGRKVALWEVVADALRDFKVKCENNKGGEDEPN